MRGSTKLWMGLLWLLAGLGAIPAASPAAPSAAPAQTAYIVGVTPQFDPTRLFATWRPLLDALQRETGLHFSLRTPAPIPAFEQAYATGAFDFAYVNPYLVGVQNHQGYLPLVRDTQAPLAGVLVVHRDSPIRLPGELADREVVFPAPKSLAGCLIIRAELEDLHGVRVRPRFVGSHDSSFLNVALGQAVAGGGVVSTLERQRPGIRDLLRVLYRTREVKALPFAAHPRVPESVRERVRAAFLALSATPTGRTLLEGVPMRQAGPADMSDYEPLRTLRLERYAH